MTIEEIEALLKPILDSTKSTEDQLIFYFREKDKSEKIVAANASKHDAFQLICTLCEEYGIPPMRIADAIAEKEYGEKQEKEPVVAGPAAEA